MFFCSILLFSSTRALTTVLPGFGFSERYQSAKKHQKSHKKLSKTYFGYSELLLVEDICFRNITSPADRTESQKQVFRKGVKLPYDFVIHL